jgi:hypothetical protein
MAIRSLLALLAVAVFASGACGGDEDEDRVEGTGYTYSVPEGWEAVSGRDEEAVEFGGVRPDSLVIGESRDDFATNVNVLREDGVPERVTAARYAELSLSGLRDPASSGLPPEAVEAIEAANPRRISEPRGAELDGEEALAWDYVGTQDGRSVRVRQLAAVADGAGYVITLTVLADRFGEGAEALGQVVESWDWE